MKFSSISRLLAHTQKDCGKVTCKHCEQVFSSNNQLHEHVRQHHSQKGPGKPQKTLLVRSGPHMPDTPPATPISAPAISEPSDHSVSMMKAPVNCPPTSPPTPPQTPASSHQKSTKDYMTIDDRFAKFAGRRSRKSLDTIPKRMRSPRSPMPGQAQITSYF